MVAVAALKAPHGQGRGLAMTSSGMPADRARIVVQVLPADRRTQPLEVHRMVVHRGVMMTRLKRHRTRSLALPGRSGRE